MIRTICGHRIEAVCDHDDARRERNFLAFEAMWVAAAIQRFVMKFDSGNHFFQHFDRAKNGGAFRRMCLHDLVFVRSKCSRLFKNAIFDADLAHIVQLSGDANLFDFLFRKIEFLGDQD